MKTLVLSVLLALLWMMGSEAAQSDDSAAAKTSDEAEWSNDLYDRIAPAPVDGGFRLADYWVWGSSVVRGEDGRFHMFVSRWPKSLPFHPGWMVASEVVHAVSETPEGPYRFNDIALSARGAQYWDGRSVHNPRVVKYQDIYVMFYMIQRGQLTHLFFATMDGPGGFENSTKSWNMVIPLRKK